MAAPAASRLAPPAGWFLSPRCIRAPVYGGTRPPLLKVAKQPTGVRRFAPASLRKCAATSANGRQELGASEYQFDDGEPLWLIVVKDLSAGLRGLVAFLAEQPRQLKHLEWPGFQNTLMLPFATCWPGYFGNLPRMTGISASCLNMILPGRIVAALQL